MQLHVISYVWSFQISVAFLVNNSFRPLELTFVYNFLKIVTLALTCTKHQFCSLLKKNKQTNINMIENRLISKRLSI